MSPAHHHAPRDYNRAFALGIALNAGFVAIEAACGVVIDSLALIADAGHNLSDVLALALAWGASALAGTRPTPRRTYGLRRVTILASLFSAILLILALGGIVWEALGRLGEPRQVDGATVVLVAVVGVAINTATALLFVKGQRHDLNLRAAFLHMAADAGVSLGVVAAGVAILVSGWHWLDPATSVAIAVLILAGTWGLLRDSLDLAIDSVPRDIDPRAVEEYLRRLPRVRDVHDLHIWAMSTTEVALTAHLTIPGARPDDGFLQGVARELHERFGIGHPTLQIEVGDGTLCRLADPETL